jgi:magnesium chelatase subunit D
MTAADEAGGLRRLLRALSCAALDPRLDGVLLFDVSPHLLEGVADLFAAVTGEDGTGAPPAPAEPVRLGASTREDDLWSRTRLRPVDGRVEFETRLGDLVEADPAAPARTVLVRDLAALSLPALRAAVTLLGAEVAAVERHGVSVSWRPRARWLAFCRTEDAGQISQHLLDRFPVRLTLPDLALPADPVQAWRAGPERAALAAALARTGEPGGPAPDDDALRHVAAFAEETGRERRGLALARLARALARLGADPATTREHVTAAARLIGLPAAAPREPDTPPPAWSPQDAEPAADPAPADGPAGEWRQQPAGGDRTAGVSESGPAEPLGAFPARGGRRSGLPYPEDEAEPMREFAPLRGPWRRTALPHAERGAVVGIRPAHDLRDLALVPTVIEAAKNRLLPGRDRPGQGLSVTAGDLRSYARVAEPERMLILLLDHTCRADWEWQQALAPYLAWAYAARAGAAVVQIGADDAPDELRAETFTARNVLDPRLTAALRRRPGRATPLAHGLLLAGQLVRRAFQQQPTALTEAWLVVVTDGRGNIPLHASLAGRLDGPVGRRGVEDALAAAGQLGALGRMRLHVVVVDVGAHPYAELPFDLADAMGGVVVAGPATVTDDLLEADHAS